MEGIRGANKMVLSDGPEETIKEDILPVDPKKYPTFSDIGGLDEHIAKLREWIIIPMLYRDTLSKYKIKPVRGVLFHGPPGTGKTLLAGALAHECSILKNINVSFFHRKAADILVKWVGESEQKLRNLFINAEERKPSVIFFDELDGLAPIRSSYQDQIHSSIVTTLLSLMDGLDRSPGIVVIAATNRLDAIDPALRRSGRFDHELYFPLPNRTQRKQILQVYTKSWGQDNRLSVGFVNNLIDVMEGYCSADLESLCSQAVMCSLRRACPELSTKTMISKKSLSNKMEICDDDLLTALITSSSSSRQSLKNGVLRRLPDHVQPLLERQVGDIVDLIGRRWPHFLPKEHRMSCDFVGRRLCGKLLISGLPGQGHNVYVTPAILHALGHLSCQIVDFESVFEKSTQSAEEVCIEKLQQARNNLPGIITFYRIDQFWKTLNESAKLVLASILEDLPTEIPLLLIATTTNQLSNELQNFFNESDSIVYEMAKPQLSERRQFFEPLLNKAMEFIENKPIVCKSTFNLSGSMQWNQISQIYNIGRQFNQMFSMNDHRSGRIQRRRGSRNQCLNSTDPVNRLKSLFNRLSSTTTKNIELTQLEMVYEVVNNIINSAVDTKHLIRELEDMLEDKKCRSI